MRTGDTAGRAFLIVALVALLAPAGALAASVQERLDSLERKVDARGLVDMLTRIEQMQRELQQLRGDIEVHGHQLQDIQRQQREQYLDIDRRLQQLETAQPATATLPGAVTGDASGTPPPAVPGTTAATPPLNSPPGAAAPAPQANGPAVVQSSTPTAVEQDEYDTALAVLREGRYSDATLAFQQFLARHPTSSYADNAGYWLGETYYVTRDFDNALKAFNTLQKDYPDSEKLADARLKSGYIHYEKKDWQAARSDLESVMNGWPGSTSARLAAERLERMKKEGH